MYENIPSKKFRDYTIGECVEICGKFSTCEDCPFRLRGSASCLIHKPWEILNSELETEIEYDFRRL